MCRSGAARHGGKHLSVSPCAWTLPRVRRGQDARARAARGVAHRRVVQRGTRVAPFTSAVNHRLLFKRAPTAGIECDLELTCCVKSPRRTDRDAKKDWTGRCIVALPPGSRPEAPWMDGPPQGATSLSLLPRCTQAGGQGSLPSVVATWPRRRLAQVHAPPAEWARAVSWRPHLGVNLLAHLRARHLPRAYLTPLVMPA